MEMGMSVREFENWHEREKFEPFPDWWQMWRWIMGALTGQSPDRYDFTKKRDYVGSLRSVLMGLRTKPKRVNGS